MIDKDKDIKFKDNPYQYIRGLRFRADKERLGQDFKKELELLQNKNRSGDKSIDLSKTADLLLSIHKQITELFFTRDKNDQQIFRKNLEVKTAWLKNHHKDIFYLYIRNKDNISIENKLSQRKTDSKRTNRKKYNLKDLTPLHEKLEKWLYEWEECSLSIKRMCNQSQDNLYRHSDIAEHIRTLLGRGYILYIYEFLQETVSSDSSLDEKIEKLLVNLEKTSKDLKSLEQVYLPSQSSGVDIAKASFNYYTVNKKPKEYYEDKLSRIQKDIKQTSFSIIKKMEEKDKTFYEWKRNCSWLSASCPADSRQNKNQKTLENKIFDFTSEQEKLWLNKYCKIQFNTDNMQKEHSSLDKEGIFLSLDETYKMMKCFKADQKSVFYEVIKHIVSGQNKSYEVLNDNNRLKGWSLSYKDLNMEGINNSFSFFQFTDKKIKNPQLVKMLAPYKDEYGKVTLDKIYTAFIDLTRKIQSVATAHNQNIQPKRLRHPKHLFLSKKGSHFKSKQEGIRQYNKQDIQTVKKDRGLFLFGKKCYFEEYGEFCELYRKIAQEKGRLKAQLKGIEREKQESQQTHFWSLICCDKNQKQLWLVPKDEMQSARQFIYEKKKNTTEKAIFVCCFESLTKRALHKLCFAEQSSFMEGMPKSFRDRQEQIKKIKTDNSEEKRKEKRTQELEFLKKVLQSNYAKEKLYMQQSHFDLQSIYKTNDIKDFEMALEKECYKVNKVGFTETEKQDFLNQFDVTVFNLSSYDLEGRNKNIHQTPASPNKRHTELWEDFWKTVKNESSINQIKGVSIGEVRLNPEVKIRWRKKNKSLQKYFAEKTFSSSFKHRQLQDQLTAHFTLTLNAGTLYEELAFSDSKEIREKIDDFNKKFNKERDFKTAWKYGIDRGQIELATLCLAKFNPSKDTYKEKDKIIVNPTFPNEEIISYTLRDLNLTGCPRCGEVKPAEPHPCNKKSLNTREVPLSKRPLIKNLSFFLSSKNLNNPDIFKKSTVTCLDLTTAKVIKGHIITNGDVMTYLKLKKAVAKRTLYELYHKGRIIEKSQLNQTGFEKGGTSEVFSSYNQNVKHEISNKISIDWSEYIDGNKDKKTLDGDGALNIRIIEGNTEQEKTVYKYVKEYENVILPGNNAKYTKQSIKNNFNHYIDQLKGKKESHTPSILQINHLRDAITANMVGVLCHLQKKYEGFVILEDLKKPTVNKHFFDNNENIARRLENALYAKFQTLGLVPPHVKDIIQLREEVRKQQQKQTKEEQKNKNHKKSQNNSVFYRQFQASGLIASQDNAPIKSSQIGAIVFVDEKDTSQACPYCEGKPSNQTNSSNKQRKDERNKAKYEQQRFFCGDKNPCGFDTYHFKSEEERVPGYTPKVKTESYKEDFDVFKDINDNDKVASYNIAKKIKYAEQIGKMTLPDNKTKE